jgi:signal transduction histidine kinase
MKPDTSVPPASLLLVIDGHAPEDPLARQLEQAGHSVVLVGYGAKIPEVTAAHAIDLVLLGAAPPTMDRLDFLENIRQAHTPLELPVIVLSPESGDSAGIAAALNSGANDCVAGAPDPAVLQARIAAQLSHKRTLERLNAKLETEIDERKQVQQHLERASKMEAIGHLAGGIAHEINTPVQYIGDNLRFLGESFEDILGLLVAFHDFTEAARKVGGLDSELAAVGEAIEGADLEYHREEVPLAIRQSLHGVEQISSIVLAMKEFSHPNTKEKSATDINRVIENAFAVCRNEWKHIAEIELDLDPTMPQIVCIPGALNQVLLNLIVNAAHAIEGLGAKDKGRISASTRRQDGLLEIRLADSGAGIPDSVRKKIFDPFFTTKEVGKGTGQGLAIAHNIVVNTHGGELTFESEAGKGTTFVIRLPLEDSLELSEAAQ